MKSVFNFILVFFLISTTSCKKASVDCENLVVGLKTQKPKIVKEEINNLAIDLKPKSNKHDDIGHKKNIESLMERLNNNCGEINAELLCYACIKTLPALSEIKFELDSAGIGVVRIIDITTPEDGVLEYAGMHK